MEIEKLSLLGPFFALSVFAEDGVKVSPSSRHSCCVVNSRVVVIVAAAAAAAVVAAVVGTKNVIIVVHYHTPQDIELHLSI